MSNLRIYLTNLGKYNEGELVGEWVDLPIDDDELQEVFKRIGIGSTDEFGQPYEEYFITDYESDINGLTVDEYENLDHLNEIAEAIENLDEWDLKIFNNAVEAGLFDAEDIEDFDPDRFRLYEGIYDDDALGEEIISEMYGSISELPEDILENNFDYASYGSDFNDSWDPYEWFYGEDQDAIKEEYGVDDIGDLDAYTYYGVSGDRELGEFLVDQNYGGVSELSPDTIESYFDYGSYASDMARYCGAYTSDGFIEDTEC